MRTTSSRRHVIEVPTDMHGLLCVSAGEHAGAMSMVRSASALSTELDSAAPGRAQQHDDLQDEVPPSHQDQAPAAPGASSTAVKSSARIANAKRSRAEHKRGAAAVAAAGRPGVAKPGPNVPGQVPAPEAVAAADKVHQRNVVQMLAPLLWQSQSTDAVAAESSTAAKQPPVSAAGQSDNPALEGVPQPQQQKRQLPALLSFLRQLCATEPDTATLCLQSGVTALAQHLVASVAAHADCAMPDRLADALRRLDADLHLEVPADAHLLLAELCIDAAGTQDALAAAAEAASAGKRGAAAAAAAEAAADAKVANAKKATLCRRAGKHIAAFGMWSVQLQAGAESASSLALLRSEHTPAREQIVVERLKARLQWALYRVARLEGAWPAAMRSLHACAEHLEGVQRLAASSMQVEPAAASANDTQPVSVELQCCQHDNVISLQALEAAEELVLVQHTLSSLQECCDSHGVRAVLGVLARPLLLDPTRQGKRLFRTPQEHEAALMQVLDLLVEDSEQAPAAPGTPTIVAEDSARDHSGEVEDQEGDAEESNANDANSSPGQALPAVVGDLTEAETVWLQVLCALQCAAVSIPLERTVARESQLAPDGAINMARMQACLSVLLRSSVRRTASACTSGCKNGGESAARHAVACCHACCSGCYCLGATAKALRRHAAASAQA